MADRVLNIHVSGLGLVVVDSSGTASHPRPVLERAAANEPALTALTGRCPDPRLGRLADLVDACVAHPRAVGHGTRAWVLLGGLTQVGAVNVEDHLERLQRLHPRIVAAGAQASAARLLAERSNRPRLLTALSSRHELWVLLAANTHAPTPFLERAAFADDVAVRAAVAGNTSARLTTLRALAADADEMVRRPARWSRRTHDRNLGAPI